MMVLESPPMADEYANPRLGYEQQPPVTGSNDESEQNLMFGASPPATVPDAHAFAPVNRK